MIYDLQAYGVILSILQRRTDLQDFHRPMCHSYEDTYGRVVLAVTWAFSYIVGDFNPENHLVDFYTMTRRSGSWDFHMLTKVRIKNLDIDALTFDKVRSRIINSDTRIKEFQFWRSLRDASRGHRMPVEFDARDDKYDVPFSPGHVKEIQKLLDGQKS